MKIAVVGAGISGLSCAWQLARSGRHEVVLYEANDYFGGHTHTVDIKVDGIRHPVDTGFLVFNHRTYPNLVQLFDHLGVKTAKSDMSFSVMLKQQDKNGRSTTDLEWAGHDLNAVFAQRRNLVNPRFLRMLLDILRFNRLATDLAKQGEAVSANTTVGAFLDEHRFSQTFRDWYLLPMAAAIWSCSTEQMQAFPMAIFIRFCHNHGLLQVNDRPQWYSVVGGGREYVSKLLMDIPDVRRSESAQSVKRTASGQVNVHSHSGTQTYDQVVLACHSDESLALLGDATQLERELLGAIRYQPNHAILHTDASVLPRRSLAHAAWNYQCSIDQTRPNQRAVCVHYLINRLQQVPFQRPVVVSLNAFDRPAPASILGEFDYAHPVFDGPAIAAQQRLPELQGRNNTWFCGAWTGYGFHEDGLKSGLGIASAIQKKLESLTEPGSPSLHLA